MQKVLGENYYHNRHSCFVLTYHMVLVTKYRHPILEGEIKDYVYDMIEDILMKHDCRMLAIDGEADHVHILFEAGPGEALVTIANVIKTQTAKWARIKYAEQIEKYYVKPYFWSDSYFISTVSNTTRNTIDRYIQKQGVSTEDTK